MKGEETARTFAGEKIIAEKKIFHWKVLRRIILMVMLVATIGAAIYYIAFQQDPQETETNSNEESENKNRETVPETLVYTTPYFPNIKINYNSTWTLTETVDVQGIPNQDTVEVVFTKEGTALTFNMQTFSSMGDGGFQTYKSDEIDYNIISGYWTRLHNIETDEYEYAYSYTKGNHGSESINWFKDETTKISGLSISAYEVFAFPNVNIETSIPDPETDPDKPHIYTGKLSVTVSVQDENLIPEVDEFFKNLEGTFTRL